MLEARELVEGMLEVLGPLGKEGSNEGSALRDGRLDVEGAADVES